MFDYDLTGKQVVLVIDPGILPALKACGITGSPLLAKVHKMEDSGIWIENPSFTVCPRGAKKIYGPRGESFCRAYVFIQARALISVVVFPHEVEGLESDPQFSSIGFETGKKKKK